MDIEVPSPEESKQLPYEVPLLADVLFKLSAELVGLIGQKDICSQVSFRLNKSLGYDFVAIFLIDETTQIRHLIASAGFENPVTPLCPGQGLSERPFFNGKLQYTPDVTKDERYFYGSGGSEVDVPIWIGEKVIGVIIAESKQKNAFSQRDFDLLTAVSQITGLALEKSRLFSQEHKRVETLKALGLTMTELTAVKDLNKLLRTIVVRAVDLIGGTGGQLAMFNEEAQDITILVCYNLEKDYVGSVQKVGEGLMGLVARTRKAKILDNYMEWSGRMESYTSVTSIYASVAVPLLIGDKLLGVFTTITSNKSQKFDQDDLYILNMFAQQAALAIESTRLYEKSEFENRERKRLYNEVLRQKEYYEALLINSPAAIVTGDLDGNIVTWNPMAEKLFGYNSEEVVGKPLNDFVANHPDIRKEADRYTKEVITVGQVMTTTKRTRRDGTFVDVELLALPVKVLEELFGFIAIYHDISELKQIERELRTKNEIMSHQLVLAGEIQSSFLPKSLPKFDGWQISAMIKPALETSGDFYDIRVLPNGNMVILIADVIDKGVGAALFMTLCWSLFRFFGDEFPGDPSRVFYELNQYILNQTQINQFVTAFYGILDPKTGEIVFSNAGHCPMYLIRDDDLLDIRRFKTKGFPLCIENNVQWEQENIVLHPGEMILLYTDGIIEAENDQGEFFGEENLVQSLPKYNASTAFDTSKNIIKNLETFVGKNTSFDDIAIIAIKREY
ncbi:MAG: SpoIIE family protein phosphatase [Anaerolineales bacterium]